MLKIKAQQKQNTIDNAYVNHQQENREKLFKDKVKKHNAVTYDNAIMFNRYFNNKSIEPFHVNN